MLSCLPYIINKYLYISVYVAVYWHTCKVAQNKRSLVCHIVITYYTGTVQIKTIMEITLWSLVDKCYHFRGPFCLYLQREGAYSPEADGSGFHQKIFTYTPNYMHSSDHNHHSHLQGNLKSYGSHSHNVHSVHCKWFTNYYTNNKCTFLLLNIEQ
jgi:hypothetical protein